MAEDAIIEVTGLSKSYRIWVDPAARIKSPFVEAVAGLMPRDSAPRRMLTQYAERNRRDFHALKDVAFSIRRGEATGIIGRNGSGKSTLLQLIAGTLTPSSGRIAVNGRVVFLNGAIYGYSRAEMERRFDEIAAFADIGGFIEQPVKTYSSGMMMRLAFSVAVAMQPDILIIDEALAVGDVFFTQK
ncbi:MAG: ATP-binding cassette domain-containing protein, partial [Candidatus Nanopelagicales bacterium]